MKVLLHPGMSEMERVLVTVSLAGDDPILEGLRQRFAEVGLIEHELTGTGFFLQLFGRHPSCTSSGKGENQMRFPAIPRWTTLWVAAVLAGCRSQVAPPPPTAYSGSSTATSEARQKAFRSATGSLSRQVNAPRDSIAGISQDETTWNDSCLGCPQTAEKCAQVLTPGYRILLRVSDATYEYHTDLGGRAKLCSQNPAAPAYAPPGYPTPTPTPYPR